MIKYISQTLSADPKGVLESQLKTYDLESYNTYYELSLLYI